ncbi:MAG: glycerol-3-phosphate acyltransferase [Acidimicrobiales bacterium]
MRTTNTKKLRPVLVAATGFFAGAVPFSNLMARRVKGVDLRTVGTGTVSGTGLFEVAGMGPLAIAGVLEVAKGALGPSLARNDGPVAGALAAAAAVAGHNWSPFLKGAGGRGLSPALGALLVLAPAGTATLLAGLVAGKLAGETSLGCLAAYGVLTPVCQRYHGQRGLYAALGVLVPLLAKRLMGNTPAVGDKATVYLCRLLFDRDSRAKPLQASVQEEGN